MVQLSEWSELLTSGYGMAIRYLDAGKQLGHFQMKANILQAVRTDKQHTCIHEIKLGDDCECPSAFWVNLSGHFDRLRGCYVCVGS